MKNISLNITCVLLLVIFSSASALAQVQIHRGNNLADYTCIYNVKNNKIYPGFSDERDQCLYVVKDNRIYKGKYINRDKSNCLYTIRHNKVYLGSHVSNANIVYTIEGNKVYKGREVTKANCIYTFDENKVYTGNSEDCFVSVKGEIDLALLVCVLEIDYIDFYEN